MKRFSLLFMFFIVLVLFNGTTAVCSEDLFDDQAAIVHLDKGKQYINRKNFNRAIAELDEAAAIRPDAETFYYLGYAWYLKSKKGRRCSDCMQKARQNFAAAYDMEPDFTPSSPEFLDAYRRESHTKPAKEEPAGAVSEPTASTPPVENVNEAVIETTATDAVFRGDAQRSGQYPGNGVPQFKKEKWKYSTRDYVVSSPVVVDSVLYATDYNGFTYAVDIATGKQKWKLLTGAFILSSPVVAENTLFIGSNDDKLAAVNLRTGQKKWEFKTGFHVISSPVVSNGTVFFGSLDKNFYALSIGTGLLKWKLETGGQIYSSPALAGGVLYFGSDDGYFYAVETRKGTVQWKIKTAGVVRSTPAIADEMVVFKCEGAYANPRRQNTVVAVDRTSGKQLWSVAAEKNDNRPRVSDDTGFRWIREMETDYPAFFTVSSPAIANNTVYYGAGDGFLYAVDAATGNGKWQLETGKEMLNEKAHWMFLRNGGILSSPSFANGIVYVGSGDGYLYAVDAESGQERWKFKTGGPVTASPVLSDGVVYIGSYDRSVRAIE